MLTIRKSDLRVAIHNAVLQGVRKTGQRIFNTSQDAQQGFVPVRTGALKRSGYIKELPLGVEIGYTAPYARTVEFGRPEEDFVGTQTVHVRQHTRKLKPKNNVVNVREHTRTYKNKRLVAFGTHEGGVVYFRVLKKVPRTTGRRFLARAIARELHSLSQDIEFYLKRFER